MKTSSKGVQFIQHEEGCRLTAYQDTKGIWTIGTGHTGPEVHKGMRITQDQANHLLAVDLVEAEYAVNKVIDEKTTQQQFDALVSLTFNIGNGAFASSTVAREHKADNYKAAANAFLLWKRAGSNPRALLPRRKREKDIYERGVYDLI